MEKHAPLSIEQLYRVCDTDLLPFKTTETLEPFAGFFGQERALDAMEFGVGMDRPGYNLFVMGTPHTGRFSFAMESLRTVAKKQRKPSDWCYLNNISDSRHPVALKLPAGKAGQFRRDVGKLMDRVLTELPAAFESPAYQRKKSQIERDFSRRYDNAVETVERQAREYSIAVYRDAGTIGFTQDLPSPNANPARARPQAIKSRGLSLQALAPHRYPRRSYGSSWRAINLVASPFLFDGLSS